MIPKNDSSLVQVGKLGRTIGLDGGLKFILNTDFPQSIQKGLNLTLVFPDNFSSSDSSYTIKSFNPNKSVVFFEGIDEITQAKTLTNAIAYVSIEDTKRLCKLNENEYFWFELIGYTIDENNEILGKVVNIERIGAIDYLIIETSEKLVLEKLPKKFLIPYIEVFIIQVSREEKSIFVKGAKSILEAS
ncbi:ribosome maturation factor RimM [Helicobacter cappadocius]|uniref:Ribosome maturation factor RimM n=1 Tax=Helicobacter cappadocius TaxID=3063998 RepID=A0AA90TF10_9HELI|nr:MULTISPECIES: ribosome maturation factor RimM [unclassified Helicobacter]MDO7253256.1 ribosome maturation factor RimM [Helicobacter sp. faydin-H75]MDP2539180.1 ribosome maturation factor RimM [Helicobacter sp. faydin-H76]